MKVKTSNRFQSYIIVSQSAQLCRKNALELACSLVCQRSEENPCFECAACRNVIKGIHPDVIEINRKTDEKGKQKKEIQVDQIRKMAADVYIRPQQADRKVYIINDAGSMNVVAQNAALKILEEPPVYAFFILCAESSEVLLATVRSRCAIVRVQGQIEREDSTLADEYISLAAQKDPAKLCAFFGKNESINSEQLSAFIIGVRVCLHRIICGENNYQGLTTNDVFRIMSLCDRADEYLRLNVGVKHILGLFCVLTF